ncbi:MAG: hypothetical protein ACRD7E_23490, partial [Bryobacteraceae bacterium]
RWEHTEDLPVRRHVHERGGTVYAYKSEVLDWYRSRQSRLEAQQTVEEHVQTPAPDPVRPVRAWTHSALVGLVVASAVALLVAALLQIRSRPFVRQSETLLSVVGRASQAVPSPTGERVIFAWNGHHDAGNLDLYIKDVQGGAPERLTSHVNNEHSPSWSADGKRIAFLRDNQGVFVSQPGQSAPAKVIAIQKPGAVYGVGSSWSADGKFFYYSEFSRGSPLEIFKLDMTTYRVERLTNPSEGQGDMYPSLSADGQDLAFIRHTRSLASFLYVLRLDAKGRPSGVPQRLTSENSRIAGLDWMPGNDGVVFSSDHSGRRRLWMLRRSWSGWKQKPEPLTLMGEEAFQPRVAKASPAMVYSRRYWPTAIWRIDLDNGGVAAGPPVKLAASAREDMEPALSPDGKRIAFISTRTGHTELWTCAADGADALQLTNFGGPLTHRPAWSPDSRRIAFHAGPERSSSIFLVAASGGSPHRITPEAMHATHPTWSHDGRRIYFTSNQGGFDRIWSIVLESGALAPLTEASGTQAHASPDGRWIYFRREGIWRIPQQDGAEEKVIPAPVGTFAVAADRIYFDRGFGDYAKPEVYVHDLRTGQTRLVARFEARKTAGISVSQDGRSLLLALNDRQSSEIVLAR